MTALSSTRRKTSAKSAAAPSLRLAAIDVGSNSLHMIVAQADSDGAVTTLWRMKEMVGLGRTSFPSRRLSRDSMDRAIAALARFQQAAQQRQCEKIVAVATSAIREAENGGDFLERAQEELNLTVRVITAREEARLIYLAVRHQMQLRDRPHLIIDIGGGSVEFIVGDEKHVYLLDSRKLGAARMTAAFIKSDPPNDHDRAALSKHYQNELADLTQRIADLKPTRIIGTSGTFENISAMCKSSAEDSDDPKSSGVIVREDFEKMLHRLLKTTSAERASIQGLDDQRKDQIIAGALLTEELFTRLRLRKIVICPAALREGILLDYLARHTPELTIRREVPDPRRRSVIDLARRCHWHRPHSEHVAMLVLRLFDELKSIHGLGSVERELIEFAAMLHDIGWHISGKSHHKHSMYLILHGDLKGFTPEEISIIANIARYHRKTIPRLGHEQYSALRARERRIVNVGASLLRLADGLDRSHSHVIENLRCKLVHKEIKCRLTPRARSDSQLELWGAARKVDMFEKTFGRTITFELAGR